MRRLIQISCGIIDAPIRRYGPIPAPIVSVILVLNTNIGEKAKVKEL